MLLTKEEKEMLSGKCGKAAKKSMEILAALGKIYGAARLVSIRSVQVAGVSYDNLGEAGLEYLEELARDGKVRVLTTLNPAGMDLENYRKLGIGEEFAGKQKRVINAFVKMGIVPSCTCTPYFIGNKPKKGEHAAWSESSAVCFANSVLGVRTNREGGPSALAAALTGKTPLYGMHIEKNRQAQVLVRVECELKETCEFGALGKAVGEKIGNRIPLIVGVKKENAGIEQLKSLCASIATYGGTAMFHMKGITPEKTEMPKEELLIGRNEISTALKEMNDDCEPDFVALGCPHLSLFELRRIAKMVKGKKVKLETWLCVSRGVKKEAEKEGIVQAIENAGIKFACDTCMVVSPIAGRFKCVATDSAKSCYYSRAKQKFKVRVGSFEKCVECAIRGKWDG
ncbi:hypothetical protein AUJ17_02490 [Candidatus Micrarchaeota archaeon CG1_02_47_40]|nr:MAG: hypothetical protein AUJ17_02490 [Candidatus Micrarchaeota archaeon CG1_02_47_40]